MKSLWERLKPELKAELLDYYKDFPNQLSDLRQELENEFYYTHVKYWVYSDLRYLTKKAFGETDNVFGNYFLPK